MLPILFDSDLKSLPLIHRGKVRDIYAVGDDNMLIVTTDRLSAFDVVLPTAIPGKGVILTRVANFWFDYFKDVIPNQMSDVSLEEAVPDSTERARITGRAVVVKKLNALPIEAIVRGYIIGSGWKDYQTSGSICGIQLPTGLQLAEQLPEALYTPSSKASVGEHDENINFSDTIDIVGNDLAEQIKQVSLTLYNQAADYARPRGIIIADTKFEFGVDSDNRLTLIDEVLTPDSSRFWLADAYQAGTSPHSFDKQYIRDYLETLDWDKTSPGPELPTDVVHNTSDKYNEALLRLTR
ncbi:MAG: phosphoribosylaminoimidazolesuccinocarboxamide synthase [Gammaproteobacteria bacterium]|nr:phosphoribosylaminoimidazolesuccinocarboxamide synthase [Gammaproteobacteria bacterium]